MPHALAIAVAMALVLAVTCAEMVRYEACDATRCPAMYDPVCATNGGTYENACQFAAAQCKNATQVVQAHVGECVRSPPRKKPVVVLVGDSITQLGFDPERKGWGLRLTYEYIRQIDVLNRGLSGYTTKWFVEFAMPELLADLSRFEPALITLWLGTNDGMTHGAQQVPVGQYRFNLKFMITKFQQAAPQAKLLLIAPPPVAEPAHCASIKEHVDVVVDVGKTLHLDVLNLYEYFMTKFPNAPERNALLVDGIHFTTDGNNALYDAIRGKIVSILPSSMLQSWQSPPFWDLFPVA